MTLFFFARVLSLQVIGAGIGGLTCAALLAQVRACRATVFGVVGQGVRTRRNEIGTTTSFENSGGCTK